MCALLKNMYGARIRLHEGSKSKAMQKKMIQFVHSQDDTVEIATAKLTPNFRQWLKTEKGGKLVYNQQTLSKSRRD